MIVRPIEYIVGRQNGRFAPKKSFVPRDVTITKEGRKMIVMHLVLFVPVKIIIIVILLRMIILTKHLETR
jgi:hypothetical protein